MEEQNKKDYEISFLVRTEEAVLELEKMLSAEKAEIFKRSEPKRITLAYPIKKENSAVFAFCHFRLAPESVQSFRERLNLNQQILRFLIVIPPPKIERDSRWQEQASPAAPVVEVKLPQVLSNEALEKTLEEILK